MYRKDNLSTLFCVFLMLLAGVAIPSHSFGDATDNTGLSELSRLNQTTRIHIRNNQLNEALTTGLQAVEMSRINATDKEKQTAYINLGVVYSIRGEVTSAIRALRQSTLLAEKLDDPPALAISLMMLGSAYSDSGDQANALKSYQRSLEIYESQQNMTGVAKLLNNIADSYDKQGDRQKSREYLTKAMEINRQNGNRKGIALQLLNLGNLDKKESEYQSALVNLNEAMAIYKSLNEQLRVVQSLVELAEVHLLLKEYEFAYDRLQEAEQISSKIGLKKELFDVSILRARTLAGLGDTEGARQELLKAERISEEIALKKRDAILLEVSSLINERQGDYRQALSEYKAFHELQLYDLSQENDRTSKEMYARFDTARKESEIALLNQENLLQEVRLKQQHENHLRLVVALITVALFSLVLLWLVHINRRSKRIIEKQNSELSDAFQQMEALARQDPLTQLLNRRGFSDLMEYEFQHQKRNQQPIVFILCDIDNFKQINDTFGHECGDRVLISVAKFLKKQIREQDTICRWGGEEFLIMLPETSTGSGSQFAERIRASLHELHFDFGESIAVTATFGVSACRYGDRPSDCIKTADQALYEGKKAGRDRVVVAREQ